MINIINETDINEILQCGENLPIINQLIDGEIWEWSGNYEKYQRIPLDNILKALDRAINGQEK